MIDYLSNTFFWNNSLLSYVYFLGYLILSLMVAKLILVIFKKYLSVFVKKTTTKIDDILVEAFDKPLFYTFFFLGLHLSIKQLNLSDKVINFVEKSVTVITIILITWGIIKLIHSALDIYWLPKAKKTSSNIDNNLIPIMKSLVTWVICIISFLFILNNLGVNITSLAAGLGVGGLAVAFALQGVFADLFASISIYLDRPFNVGDYIVIGADSGTVKKIGLKSTRITTLQGEELVVSNKELTETRVKNYKRMRKRRVAFYFGVEYGTGYTKLDKIPKIIEKIIKSVKDVDFDRANFTEFGDSALNFEVIMYINNRDYTIYRQIQEKINLKIVQEFNKEKISMAFPTQTIHLKK
jgi:small-conductance mechanosensitive channel